MPYKDPIIRKEKSKIYQKRSRTTFKARDSAKFKENYDPVVWRAYVTKNLDRWMLGAASRRARKLNLPFNLVKADIVIPEICPVLGIKLYRGIGKIVDNSPTLDRVIPDKGYTKGNVKVISHRANSLKSNATLEELVALVKYVRENTEQEFGCSYQT